jgi:hypothetical protein
MANAGQISKGHNGLVGGTLESIIAARDLRHPGLHRHDGPRYLDGAPDEKRGPRHPSQTNRGHDYAQNNESPADAVDARVDITGTR